MDYFRTKPKMYHGVAYMDIGNCWKEMHHAMGVEGYKAALEALRTQVEQQQAEKELSRIDGTSNVSSEDLSEDAENAEVCGDKDSCNSEEAAEEHERRVSTLWQKAKETAFAAGGVGVRVGIHGMAGIFLGEFVQMVERLVRYSSTQVSFWRNANDVWSRLPERVMINV